MNGRPRAMAARTLQGTSPPSSAPLARLHGGLGLAALLAAAVAGWAGPVHAAPGPAGSQGASAGDQNAGGSNQSGRLVLALTTPDLAGSARRDFELNLTRGLRFSGLEVVAESAGGTTPALAACADLACVRAIGKVRSAAALARASVRAPSNEDRTDPRRSYTIEIEVVPTTAGRAAILRRNDCANCTVDVAAHLAYLLAAQIGQEVGQGWGQTLADGSSSAAPAAASAPPAPATAPAVRPAEPVRPISVARTPPTSAPDASAPAPPMARETSDRPTAVPRRLAAAVLGGLGVAALTSGAVLWLRGPQSTCPGLPPSACGQTYDDTTTGQVLVGAGAAALAGAILWWSWPAAEEHPMSSRAPRVAITSTGVLVGGRF